CNTYYIAYEEFNYLSGNAKLKCIDLNGSEFPFFDEINNNIGHKSFPYVFEVEGHYIVFLKKAIAMVSICTSLTMR
ncbi:hypothetical protein, partial [Citrobacter werkmanii]|uniref:hypothetical protein n=1 Tax=Citrobacter werkmanii TaxID=67827 RepID=UPI001C2CFA21